MIESADVLQPAGQDRRPYAVPALILYGNLVELTATGSMQQANESANGAMCFSNLNVMVGVCGN